MTKPKKKLSERERFEEWFNFYFPLWEENETRVVCKEAAKISYQAAWLASARVRRGK